LDRHDERQANAARCEVEEFQGKTAVVSSAASGIGLALARRLAREGMNVGHDDLV